MLKPILNYWQNNALLWALIATVGITVGSLINPTYIVDSEIKNSDKILHTVSYMILMLTWLMYVKENRISINQWLVFIILIIFGIILELFQGNLTQNRSGEIWDVFANTLGLIIGLMIFNILIKRLIH